MKSKMIKKAVITAGGLGTRLLPISKSIPKEMLPVFVRENESVVVKPFIQLIFEDLYELGIREFCFVINESKKDIVNYFRRDSELMKILEQKEKQYNIMENFYKKIDDSKIFFVSQDKPIGFGHAVLQAKDFAGNDEFIVMAGDDFIIPRKNALKRLMDVHTKKNADCVILSQRVEDPRRFGVIEGNEIEKKVFRVTRIVEKPKNPESNITVIAIYTFDSKIFDALEKTSPGHGNEIQLTDAIAKLVDNRGVYTMEINDDEERIDLGVPEGYKATLDKIL